MKEHSLSMKGNLYAYARNVMLHSDETWLVKEKDICKHKRTEIRMEKWMSNTTLSDRIPSTEL